MWYVFKNHMNAFVFSTAEPGIIDHSLNHFSGPENMIPTISVFWLPKQGEYTVPLLCYEGLLVLLLLAVSVYTQPALKSFIY